ncbi:MAG: hypothetical protein HYZ37_19300 [Candidatus Solibacter usitatus]|nr:hypothetical protein [Candidatus Solibacter usitatus]
MGPYMGFGRVELMVEGHNHWPPMKPPRGQHYERWFHKDGRGEELQRLYETKLPPLSTAMQTFHSGLPVAFHNSTWIGDRSIDFLSANKAGPFCLWAMAIKNRARVRGVPLSKRTFIAGRPRQEILRSVQRIATRPPPARA